MATPHSHLIGPAAALEPVTLLPTKTRNYRSCDKDITVDSLVPGSKRGG